MREILLDYVDDLLDRYTSDEVGENQRQQYKEMNDDDKLVLILSTIYKEVGKSDDIDDILDNIDINIVINFNFSNY